MGMTALLCDIGQSLEIVCEHTLFEKINEYVDTYLFDFKTASEEKYSRTIGGDVKLVKENIKKQREARSLAKIEKAERVYSILFDAINTLKK